MHLFPSSAVWRCPRSRPGRCRNTASPEMRMRRTESRSPAARSIRRSSRCAKCSRPPSGTAGYRTCRTFPRPTGLRARWHTGHGSRPRSTGALHRHRKRALEAKGKRWQWHCEQLHDYVLFMANTGLRPDEAAQLEYRDVKVVEDEDTRRDHSRDRSARQARGRARQEHAQRRATVQTAPPSVTRRKAAAVGYSRCITASCWNRCWRRRDLNVDREGNRRTAYSLRHTYICLRLMEGADIYQIAKNCRTSVEMIEKHYAAHIRTALDTDVIDVRRERPRRNGGRHRRRHAEAASG